MNERPELSPIDQLRKKAETLKNKYTRASEVFSGLETRGFTTKPGLRLDTAEDDPDHPEWSKVENIVRVGEIKERLEEVAIPKFLNQLEEVAGQIETAEAQEAVFEARLVRLTARRETVQRLVQKGILDPGQLTVVDGEIEKVRVQQRQAIVPVQPVEQEVPVAEHEETLFVRTKKSYEEANQFFEITLPDGQIAQVKGEIKARALEALIRIGNPVSSEKLCEAIYGEYNSRGSDRISAVIKRLREDLGPYNYQILQPIGSRERGQGKRANYYLEPVQEKIVAPVQEVIPGEGIKRFDSKSELFAMPNGIKMMLGPVEKGMVECLVATMASGQPVTYEGMARQIYRRQLEQGYSMKDAVKTLHVLIVRLMKKLGDAGYKKKRLPIKRYQPGEFILEEVTMGSVVGSQGGDEPEDEEAEVTGLGETPVVSVSAGPAVVSIDREEDVTYRPWEPSSEEVRSEMENRVMEIVVAMLQSASRRDPQPHLRFIELQQALGNAAVGERVRRVGSQRQFRVFDARELQKMFESALKKIKDEAEFEVTRVSWNEHDRSLWREIEGVVEGRFHGSIEDMKRTAGRFLNSIQREFYLRYPAQNGGKVYWLNVKI